MTGLMSSMTGLTSSSPSVLLSSYEGVSLRRHTAKSTYRTKQRILIIVLVLITRHLAARLSLPSKPSSELAFTSQLGLLALTNGRIHLIVRFGGLFAVEVAGSGIGADEFFLQTGLVGVSAEGRITESGHTLVSRSSSSSSTPSATASSSSATSSLKSSPSSSARSIPCNKVSEEPSNRKSY